MNGDQAILEIHSDMKALRNDVSSVMVNGCSKREGDLEQLKDVKEGLKEMRGDLKNIYRTGLVTCAGIAVFVIKMLIGVLFP